MPWSLLVVVALTGAQGIALGLVAVWSFLSHSADLGISVGIMVAMYAVIVLGSAWFGWRRSPWSWGLLAGVALLNGFTATDFIRTEDPVQFGLSAAWLVVCVVSLGLTLLPSTRLALHR